MTSRGGSYGSGSPPSTSGDPTYSVSVDRTTGRVIDAFLLDGRYKNQFETGITSGSSTAFPGGSRDGWEKECFADGYHGRPLVPEERPKYGAMNLGRTPAGTASSYGSCYLLLRDGARGRASFTPRDSSGCKRDQVGTVDAFVHVLRDRDDGSLKEALDVALGRASGGGGASHNYLEMQVHGPLEFGKDAARLVASARYLGTPYEAKLREFAEKFKVEILWREDAA